MPERRINRLVEFFSRQLGKIISMDPATIDPQAPLGSLGLDSLMAIELKNSVEAKLDISLPISKFMSDPSLESLAETAAELMTEGSQADGESNGAESNGAAHR